MTAKRLFTLALAAVLAAGIAAAAPSRELVVVQIGPVGDHGVPPAIQLGQGMQALFAAVNARGGIRGDRIRFVQVDDGGDPARFVQRLDEMAQRDTLAVLSPFGSPAVAAMLRSGVLDHADTVVINAVPGAEAFRKPGHPKLFHVRAGDGQQIDRVVDHAHTLGLARMAALHIDTPGGDSELASAQEAARRVGGIQVTGFKSGADGAAIATAARRLAASDTQAALVLGPPDYLTDAVGALRRAGFSRAIFTLSYLDPESLAALGPGVGRGVGIAQTFPDPMGIVSPLQREFHAAMKISYPTMTRYTPFQFEGYVTARLFVEATRAATHATPADIARSLHAMGEINLGGFHLDFSRGNTGSRFTDIAVVNEAGRLTY